MKIIFFLIFTFHSLAYTQLIENIKPMGVPEGAVVNSQIFFNDKLYIATGNEEVDGGIFEFTNGKWNLIYAGKTGNYFTSIFKFNNILLVGTNNNGIYKSKEGLKFELITDGLKNPEFGILTLGNIKGFAKTNNALYLNSQEEGLFVSFDDAESWQIVPENQNIKNINFIVGIGDYLYVGNKAKGIIRTKDNANTWEDFNVGYSLLNNPNFIKMLDGKMYLGSRLGLQVYSVDSLRWLSPRDENESIYITNSSVLGMEKSLTDYILNTDYMWQISIDSAQTWTDYNINLPYKINNFIADEFFIYLNLEDSKNYIFNREDRLFTQNTNGLSNTNCLAVFFDDEISLISQANSNKKLLLLNNFGEWEEVENNFYNNNVRLIIEAFGNLILVSGRNYLFQSSDKGYTWSRKQITNSIGNISLLHKSENNLYMGTKDFGQGTFIVQNNNFVYRVMGLPLDDNLGMASIETTLFAIIKNKGLFRSMDDGITWENITDRIDVGFEFNNFTDIEINENKIILVRNTGEVYISINLGNDWTFINQGETISQRENIHLFNDLIIVNNGNEGIEYTSDYGWTWSSVKFDNVENIVINDIVSFENKVYFLTNGHGIWYSDYVLSTKELGVLSKLNVFPMPARDNINIEFELKEAGSLEISLYDINGIKIQDIYNDFYGIGIYKNNIDISNLESGSYFLMAKTDKENIFEKLIVVK